MFTILWPHQFVHRPGTFDLIFDNLTLAEFVAGTSAILLLPKLPEAEKKARLEHLQFLMLLSRSFSWDSLRALYAVALEDIQCGHRKWGDSLVDLCVFCKIIALPVVHFPLAKCGFELLF